MGGDRPEWSERSERTRRQPEGVGTRWWTIPEIVAPLRYTVRKKKACRLRLRGRPPRKPGCPGAIPTPVAPLPNAMSEILRSRRMRNENSVLYSIYS